MMAVVVPIEEEDVEEARTEKPCDAAVDAKIDDVFLIAAAVCLGKEIRRARC